MNKGKQYKIIAKHDGQKGDVCENEQFLGFLNHLFEQCKCNVRIDEYYNFMLDVVVPRNGLKDIYVYYTEEVENTDVANAYVVNAYIFKVSGLEELRELLCDKSPVLDGDEIEEKIKALRILFE